MSSSSLPMHQRRKGGDYNRSNGSGSSSNMYNNRYNPGHLESGRGGGPPGRMSANDTNASIMEQQNNDRLDQLGESVAKLKSLTIDIGNEVKEQNSLLDNMSDGFSATGDMLARSLGRIGTMLESGGAKHMCYMVAFVVGVMVFLYWLMTYKGQSGA